MTADRPLTRREIRERERAAAESPAHGPGVEAAARAAAPAAPPQEPRAITPQQEPQRRPRQHRSSLDPVEWRLSTSDMSSVRDELDARFSGQEGGGDGLDDDVSRAAERAASPAEQPAPATRRSRRDEQVPAGERLAMPETPVQHAPPVPRATVSPGERSAPHEPEAPARAADAPSEDWAAATWASSPSSPLGDLPDTAPTATASGTTASGNTASGNTASRPLAPEAAAAPRVRDQAAHRDEVETGPDGYFERLATASVGDAPTGMIVMPEVINPDITGALSGSGDVMVTGSMRISRDLSSFGAYRDGLDQFDAETGIVTDERRSEHSPVPARDAVSLSRAPGVRVAPEPHRHLGVWIWVVVGAIGVAVVGGGGVLLYGVVSGWF
ncbi:hypothetical protein GCM10011490_27700 [Pseudoclavibacter endophyticus]|uniref:Uncharacterized protein n=1 Tax=Pseudoclavibacter endophyticus TaxID=1778590 RepID=A0A6H9WAP5_9MICO|nr:hypothetical protein [Pseudoclavibacter endophyticus]KAB1646804.1 hypothetical protein F8O04_13795 [Pseudoclavibacter endophyticus]GGA75393.1 hypothetical protein GCM10011490_27700 [Pseudoclavibacter endophyticus]